MVAPDYTKLPLLRPMKAEWLVLCSVLLVSAPPSPTAPAPRRVPAYAPPSPSPGWW